MTTDSWPGLDKETLAWLAGGSLVMLVASALLLPFVVLRLPADHFLRDAPRPSQTRLQFLRRLAGNLCGALMLVAGVAMLALPGQGLLTLLIGLSWMTFPGKVAVERWIVTRFHLMGPLNWIRKRAHREPLSAPGVRKSLLEAAPEGDEPAKPEEGESDLPRDPR